MIKTPKLHPDMIEQVREAAIANLPDLVAEYLPLKKVGKELVGLCPFHSERSPSFSISPAKGLFYCFGCQASGDGIKFMMDLNRTNFRETIIDLSQRFNIPVKTVEPDDTQALLDDLLLRSQLYKIMAIAAKFYHNKLLNRYTYYLDHANNSNKPNLPESEFFRYELNGHFLVCKQINRKISIETAKEFSLGFAEDSDELKLYLKHLGYSEDLLEKAGLYKSSRQFFKNRLIIPILDAQGRAIALAGRSLVETSSNKYINSPETEIFKKGSVVFGLDKAKSFISIEAIAVEGYFDVIDLHCAGVKNAIACMGTGFSEKQLNLILKYNQQKQITLAFDNDSAGKTATLNFIKNNLDKLMYGELNLKVFDWSNTTIGNDPSDFIQFHGEVRFSRAIASSPTWIGWNINSFFVGKNMLNVDDFRVAAREVENFLGMFPNNALKAFYVELAIGKLGIVDPILKKSCLENIYKLVPAPSTPDSSPNTNNQSNDVSASLLEAESLIITLSLNAIGMLKYSVSQIRKAEVEIFTFPFHRQLWNEISTFYDSCFDNNQDIDSLETLKKLYNLSLDFCLDSFSEAPQDIFYPDDAFKEKMADASYGYEMIYKATLHLEKNACENISSCLLDEFMRSKEYPVFDAHDKCRKRILEINRQLKALVKIK